jgi:hypothetical protein
LVLAAPFACGASLSFSVVSKEVNSGKNDVYYRILLDTKDKAPSSEAIESLCKKLDSEGRRKFVANVFLPGMTSASPAYATCGRLPNAPLEVKVFGGSK